MDSRYFDRQWAIGKDSLPLYQERQSHIILAAAQVAKLADALL